MALRGTLSVISRNPFVRNQYIAFANYRMITTGVSVLGFQNLVTVQGVSFGSSDFVIEILGMERDQVVYSGYVALQYFEPLLERYFQLWAQPLYQRGIVGVVPAYPGGSTSSVSIVAFWRLPGLNWRAGIA